MIDSNEELFDYKIAEYLDRNNLKLVALTSEELREKRDKVKEKEAKERKRELEIKQFKIKKENEFQLFLYNKCVITHSDDGVPMYIFSHFMDKRTVWDVFSLREYYNEVINGLCKAEPNAIFEIKDGNMVKVK